MNRILKNFFTLILSGILIGGIAVFVILWVFSNKLPDYKFLKNYKPSVSSKVYSGKGELVSDFSAQKRIFVPYNSIPKKVINSFLSSEDKNFFHTLELMLKEWLEQLLIILKIIYIRKG